MRQSIHKTGLTARRSVLWASGISTAILLASSVSSNAQIAEPPSPVAQAAPSLAPSASPQKYLLRYKYAKGLSYEYSFSIDTSGTATEGTVIGPIDSHIKIIALLTFQDVAPDGSQATVSYHYLSMQATINGVEKTMSPAQLQLADQAVPKVRVTQSGKLAAVAGAITPGPVSKLMSSAQMLQGTPLPDEATPIGGVWRGVFSMMGANTFVRSTLTGVTTNAGGDQIFAISQKFSEQSKAQAPSNPALPSATRYYIYESGSGEQQFDNSLGTLVLSTFTLSGRVTAQSPSTTIPVRTQSTTIVTMQLMPTSPLTVAATGKPLPAPAPPPPVPNMPVPAL